MSASPFSFSDSGEGVYIDSRLYRLLLVPGANPIQIGAYGWFFSNDIQMMSPIIGWDQKPPPFPDSQGAGIAHGQSSGFRSISCISAIRNRIRCIPSGSFVSTTCALYSPLNLSKRFSVLSS